jgi:hypothetical protein
MDQARCVRACPCPAAATGVRWAGRTWAPSLLGLAAQRWGSRGSRSPSSQCMLRVFQAGVWAARGWGDQRVLLLCSTCPPVYYVVPNPYGPTHTRARERARALSLISMNMERARAPEREKGREIAGYRLYIPLSGCVRIRVCEHRAHSHKHTHNSHFNRSFAHARARALSLSSLSHTHTHSNTQTLSLARSLARSLYTRTHTQAGRGSGRGEKGVPTPRLLPATTQAQDPWGGAQIMCLMTTRPCTRIQQWCASVFSPLTLNPKP